MKRLSGPRRTPSNLSDSVHQRLNMYALAAGAAGVGMLALAQPSEAKIIYTRTDRLIDRQDGFELDLNHDDVTDFTVKNYTYCNTDRCFFNLVEKAAPGNGVEGIGRRSFQPFASALSRGARIGRGRRFYGGTAILAYVYAGGGGTGASGEWANVTNRYLGLSFKINRQTHYGWARLSVRVHGTSVTGTLTGYAYETIPNKPIIAGKTKGRDDISSVEEPNPAALAAPPRDPATLGALAMGAPGLSIWRRKESALEGNRLPG
jgi:hypothetical protein